MKEQETSSSKNTKVIIGGQWGDEGKGKLVDALAAQDADAVVRFNGGSNAGHNVENEKGKFALHTVPSGICNPDVINIVARGTVVNLIAFPQEIEDLQQKGIEISSKNLRVSRNAHLIMPWHIKRDNLSEKARGKEKIGTTGQGVGPSYADRRERKGFRVKDLFGPNFEDEFDQELRYQERLTRLMDNELLVSELKGKDLDEIEDAVEMASENRYYDREVLWEEQVRKAKDILGPLVTDTADLIWKYHEQGKRVLGEGAQGVLIGFDDGEYPFVTSSDPTVYGFIKATGIPYEDIDAIGAFKAYSTRVGSGSMPTEQNNDIGEYIRRKGNEIGATTGRDRRIGWFDAVAARYAIKRGGIKRRIALMKTDVLDELDIIRIGVGYEVGGTLYTTLSEMDDDFMSKVTVIYEDFPGWREDTTGVRSFEEFPENAQRFTNRIQELIGLPIDIYSVGPERSAMFYR